MADQRLDMPPSHGFPVVGMIGGGQLARMTAQAAVDLGIEFAVLSARDSDSAGRIVARTMVGDPDDPQRAAQFARHCDVVTFDHEQVPPTVLAAIEETGVPMRPSPAALLYAQDKVQMRRLMDHHGLPSPEWRVVADRQEAEGFARAVGYPIILKVSRGGYDGRGVWVCRDETEIEAAMAHPLADGVVWLAEHKVNFTQELSAMVVRSATGEAQAYPVVRTVQTDGMCTEVVAPAPGLSPEAAEQAAEMALRVAEAIGLVGVLAVEMFDDDGTVLINELAMRPHNSGHWTMDGADTSQFENHLRAVLGLPLGSCSARADWTVMANVVGSVGVDLYGGMRDALALADPESTSRTVDGNLAADLQARVHLYGKEARPGRKLGHVNAYGDDLPAATSLAREMAELIAEFGGTDA